LEPSPYEANLKRVDKFASMMDSRYKIPFTPFKIGLDGIIGLLPGIGDGSSFVMALYPVVEAHRMGVGFGTKLRMLWNLLIDTVLGTIPLIGDLFDIGFKANNRNAKILRDWVAKQERKGR